MPLLSDPAEAPWTSEGEEFYTDLRRKVAIKTCDDLPVFDESIFDDIKLQPEDRDLLESVIARLQQAVLVCDTPKVPVSATGPLTEAGATYPGSTGWSRAAMSTAMQDIQIVLGHYA